MTGPLVIAGAGEHGRVVAEAAVAAGWEPVGWCGPAPDDRPGTGTGLPWLGTDADLAARLGAASPGERPSLVLGFGGPPATRRAVVERIGVAASWAAVVHPAAWISPSARLGQGAVVLAGAIVNSGASVGDHAIVNSGAIVEHDVEVGDHAHVAPGATIGGGARIGAGAFVGLNASVRDHVSVGARAIVAMGAVVVADVPEGATVTGVPARVSRGAVTRTAADG